MGVKTAPQTESKPTVPKPNQKTKAAQIFPKSAMTNSIQVNKEKSKALLISVLRQLAIGKSIYQINST